MFVDFENLGQIGIITDLEDTEIPEGGWSSGNNVVFRDGIAQRITGETPIFSSIPHLPENISFYPDPESGNAYWISAGFNTGLSQTDIQAWDGQQFVNLSGDIGNAYTTRNGWTSGSIAGVPYINNGTGAPWAWLRGNGVDLDPAFTQILTWPAGMQAMYVRPFLNFYVLMDITEPGQARNPSRLLWSNPAQPYQVPSDFDIADPTSLAGDVILGDTADYLVDCMQLRGINIVYKRNETWSMRPVSGSQVFRFDRIFRDLGLLGPRLVAPVRGTHHFCVTNTLDIIIHDGNTKTSIADERVKRTIFPEINQDELLKAFVKPHNVEEEIWFHYPTSGNTWCNKVAIWNYKSGAWAFRDADNVTDMAYGIPDVDPSVSDDSWDNGPALNWDSETTKVWNEFTSSLLVARDLQSSSSGYLVIDNGKTFSGNLYNSVLERIGIDFGEPDRRKQILAVYPKISGASVDISIGSTSVIDKPYTWDKKTFRPGFDHKLSFRVNGRYMGIRIEGTELWRLDGLRVDVIVRGIR